MSELTTKKGGTISPHTSDISSAGSPLRIILGPIAAQVAFVFELTLVPLILPAMMVEFALTMGELAHVFTSYGIAVAVGVLLGGWLGDMFDARRIFIVGVVLFMMGSMATAAAETYFALIAGRVIQGLGGGVFAPLVPVLLTRASSERPGRVLIVWGSIAGYIAAFGPILFGAFPSGDGWRQAFILNALAALIALLVVASNGHHRTCSPPGHRQGRRSLLRSPEIWLVYLYVFFTYGSITYYLFLVPNLLSENASGAAGIGVALTLLWLTFSGASTLLRNLVDESHLWTIMLAAPILIAMGLLAAYFNGNVVLRISSAMLVGAGLACSNAPSTLLILRFAPNDSRAFAASLDITFARLGGIAMVALLAGSQFVIAASSVCFACVAAAGCAQSARILTSE